MKSLARLLARLPLGPRLVNFLYVSKLTWLRCFPGSHPARRCQSYLRLAYHSWSHRNLPRALHFLAHAEQAQPHSPPVHYLRGLIRYHQNQLDQARQSLQQSLHGSGLSPEETRQAHRLLAELVASAGDLPQACDHMAQALEQPGKFDQPTFPSRILEAWDRLAESVINERGNLDLARACFQHKEERRRELVARTDPDLRDTLLLPDDWVRNIGHLALLDGQVKLQKLGHAPKRTITLLAPREKVANQAYLAHWKPYLRIVQDPVEVDRLSPWAPVLGQRVSSFWAISPVDQRYFLEALGFLQMQWESAGHGPLLRLQEDCEELGQAFLREQGVPRDAWFVSLHVRESGFHGEVDTQNNRDVDVRSYLPALRAIVKRGGWVVRLGNSRMAPLPRLPGLIDYAHHPRRRPELDVFFSARSRFFIGTASGLVHVPFTFGVPCVVTNWVSNAMMPPFARGDLFLPKRIRDLRTGRLLSWEEQCAPGARNLHYNHQMLVRNGLEVVNNSAQELQAVVKEMLDRLEGRAPDSNGADALQEKMRCQARSQGLEAPPRMGQAFLRSQCSFL